MAVIDDDPLGERDIPSPDPNALIDGAYVRLVWGIRRDGRCDLIAIATNDDALTRYTKMGEMNNQYLMVKDELAMVNHAFGAGMLPNALNKAQPR